VKCKICDRETKEDYCKFHEMAYRNIEENFIVWEKAIGVSWREYLKELVVNSFTGTWVKEIAEDLLKSNEG